MVCEYDYDENTMKIRVKCTGCLFGSSIEDFPMCMATTIDKLLETKKFSSVILARDREYEYGYEQVKMLAEIAKIVEDIVREQNFSYSKFNTAEFRHIYPDWMSRFNYIAFTLLLRDPIGAYVELKREMRKVEFLMGKAESEATKAYLKEYNESVLEKVGKWLSETKMIRLASPNVYGYHVGDRTLYRQLFMASIRPNFMFTRYLTTPPEKAESMDRYQIGDMQIEIFKLHGKAEYMYFAMPPEFKLSEEKYIVLDTARRYMVAHKPTTEDFVRSERIREIFFNIGKDVIRDVSDKLRMQISGNDIEQLANILTRYTAGYGVLEILLADERVQDIYINSPVESQSILVFHQDWEECKTNLIPTKEDAEAWATRLRIQSGRPLDEANPVLDVDIGVPGGRARFAVITKSLSPEGLGFAIRRHRFNPWTLPLFVKTKYINPLAAGLMSFLIDNSASLLMAGGRGSGKTSLMAAMMLELLPKTRIVVIEDSVTGDCEMLYRKGRAIRRSTVAEIIDEQIKKYGRAVAGREISRNPEGIEIYSMTKTGKVKLAKVGRFIRHEIRKDIFEVETRTGRKISVTGDHSLFSVGVNGGIEPIEARRLKKGDYICTNRLLPISQKESQFINLFDYMGNIGMGYIVSESLRRIIWNERKRLRGTGYSKGGIQWWYTKGIIPVGIGKIILDFRHADPEGFFFKSSSSKKIPVKINLTDSLLTFFGLWLADGCYDRNSVIISVDDKESRGVVRHVGKMFGLETKMHSDGLSLMLNSKALKLAMKALGFEGDAFTKRIPDFVYDLSSRQIGCMLKGLFSGDGCVSDKEIVMDLRSEKMIKDVQTLLLSFGIIARCRTRNGFYKCHISSLKSLRLYKKDIGILQKYKSARLDRLCSKTSTHDSTDIIPLPLDMKKRLIEAYGIAGYDYIGRQNNMGREFLSNLVSQEFMDDDQDTEALIHIQNAGMLASSDIFWDEVREIRRMKAKDFYVYDFSVPETENFICENVVAHNTLELPIDQLIKLEYNIESLKSRSVITRVETEMPADEALRTSLRLGDSAMIVGEIRSLEAKALWEAMRIGALSNVVAGTIHGESAYGVFDRVVNDLGVPVTSFKATDIISVSKMLKTADGLHRFRRLTEITEIRKKWSSDPMKEGAFVNLMEYSAKDDTLKPTDTFVNGESEVLNRIANLVKEWSGNWEAVWENINLRGRMKQTMVEMADRLDKPEILEAYWMTQSNSRFHLIADAVRRETGSADPKRIYELWLEWLKEAIQRPSIG